MARESLDNFLVTLCNLSLTAAIIFTKPDVKLSLAGLIACIFLNIFNVMRHMKQRREFGVDLLSERYVELLEEQAQLQQAIKETVNEEIKMRIYRYNMDISTLKEFFSRTTPNLDWEALQPINYTTEINEG